MVAGGDSHTCTYGALGAFGTGLGSTDIAYCLALRRVLAGGAAARSGSSSPARSGRFVTGKDLILAVIGEIGVGGGTNAALEFVGDGAAALSVDERLAVVEHGRRGRARRPASSPPTRRRAPTSTAAPIGRGRRSAPIPDAEFAQTLTIDLDGLEPLVALPHLPGNVVPVTEAAGIKIDQVYIGNCSNGTMTDLRQAAEILRGRTRPPATAG